MASYNTIPSGLDLIDRTEHLVAESVYAETSVISKPFESSGI